MFFKNLKAKRRKELKTKIAEYEQDITNYQMLLEDIKNNYLPLRDRCEKAIRDNGLNHYRLRDVLTAAYDDDKLTLAAFKVEEDEWDGEKTTRLGDKVFEETVQLRRFNRESFVASLILQLRDPTKAIEHDLELSVSFLLTYKVKLNDLK